jgi:hypothetical protein
MPRTSSLVQVPKPAPGSFNKDRPAGKLLQAQVTHLRKAMVKHHAEVVTLLADAVTLLAIDPDEIRTEGEVSEYARKITAILRRRSASGLVP